MVGRLRDIVDQARGVVVLASAVPGIFCSGADTKVDDAVRRQISSALYSLYAEIRASDAVFLAALDGPAVGGGAQLAVCSDLRFMSLRSYMRFAGPAHGLAVAAWSLPSLVGRGLAVELCLTMREIYADEAVACGLANAVSETPVETALETAGQIATLDLKAAARVKRIAWEAAGADAAFTSERDGNAGWGGSVSPSGHPR